MSLNENSEDNSGYGRLEDQIRWYDGKAVKAQNFYKFTKIFEIVFGSMIPFVAGINPSITAGLGIAIVVLETTQHLFQWQYNWISYRATCETLRHEKYSFLGKVGSYRDLSDEIARKTLIERVESLISVEHSKWVYQQTLTIKKAHSSGVKN